MMGKEFDESMVLVSICHIQDKVVVCDHAVYRVFSKTITKGALI
jgi:hypothetical protein